MGGDDGQGGRGTTALLCPSAVLPGWGHPPPLSPSPYRRPASLQLLLG